MVLIKISCLTILCAALSMFGAIPCLADEAGWPIRAEFPKDWSVERLRARTINGAPEGMVEMAFLERPEGTAIIILTCKPRQSNQDRDVDNELRRLVRRVTSSSNGGHVDDNSDDEESVDDDDDDDSDNSVDDDGPDDDDTVDESDSFETSAPINVSLANRQGRMVETRASRGANTLYVLEIATTLTEHCVLSAMLAGTPEVVRAQSPGFRTIIEKMHVE